MMPAAFANVAGTSGGLLIAGTNAALTISGALTVNGGASLLCSSGGDALTLQATSGNASGLNIIGIGSSAAVRMAGGATGAALSLIGGGTSGAGISITTTSGDGISVTPTAGHALVLTANGTSKHGAVITGGTAGTSDGLKAVAGTGGVPIRGDITGNLVGTVSTLTTYTGNTPQTGDSYALANGSSGFVATKADTAAIKTKTDFLPSAVAGAAGGVFIAGTNAATTITTGLTAHLIGTVDTVTTLTNLPAITAGWLTATGIAADAITAAKIADGAIDTATFAASTTLPRVTLVDTTTTNTDMRGTDSAALASVWTSTRGGYVDNLSGGAVMLASSYTAPLSAAGTRSAVGLASANLDTQLSTIAGYVDTEVAAIKARTDNLPAAFPTNFADLSITASTGRVTVGTVSDKTGYSLAAAGLDSVVIETGLNARQALSLSLATLAGVLSGAATTTVTILGAGVASTRIVASVDGSGNRTALALTPPA